LAAVSPSDETARDPDAPSVSTTAVTFIPRLAIDEIAERVNAAVGAAVPHPMLILALVSGTHGFYVRPEAPA
jgi:hypothetical protein